MSWLSSLAGKAKDAAVGVGHAVGHIASNPIVEGLGGMALGSGVGTLLGAAGGALKPGGGLSGAVKGAGTGYLSGVAGQAAGGLLGSGAAGLGALGAGGITGALGSAGSFLKDHAGSLLGGAESALGGGGSGGMSPALLALAGLQGVNAAQLGAKANQYADNAMNTVNDSWNARAGLRSQGIAGLSQARPMQNLSSLTAIRGQNPVAARAGLPPTAGV